MAAPVEQQQWTQGMFTAIKVKVFNLKTVIIIITAKTFYRKHYKNVKIEKKTILLMLYVNWRIYQC